MGIRFGLLLVNIKIATPIAKYTLGEKRTVPYHDPLEYRKSTCMYQ